MLPFSVLVILLLQSGLVFSDVSGSDPDCEKCLCADVSSSLNLRDAPGGSVVGSIQNGECFKYTGEKEAQGGYTWFTLNYNGYPSVWAAGEFLVLGSDSSCTSERTCLCVTATALNARSAPSTSATIEAQLTNGECRVTKGETHTNDGYEWFKLFVEGQSLWAAGKSLSTAAQYLETGCFRDCEDDKCSLYDTVKRAGWNAAAATSSTTIATPVKHVFIHHTAGNQCTSTSGCKTAVKGIQTYHMGTNGWSDIGYSFLIGGDGKVYEGRGWNKVGAHTSGYNSDGYGIAFIGTFISGLPSGDMLNAAKLLIACGVQKGHIASDYSLAGHKDTKCTACPGAALYDEVKTWDNWHKVPNFNSISPPQCW